MFYEVQGVEFVNKGAELMLHAIIRHLESVDKNAIAAADLDRRYRDTEGRKKAGLQYLTWVENRIPNSGAIINGLTSLIPSPLRRNLKLVLTQEIDVLLDASGFSYTDQWKPTYAEKTAEKLLKLKTNDKKVILLPQAFGPFEKPRVKAAFQTILDCSDLVFARDRVSYDYVQDLNPAPGKLYLAPDFTNLISGRVPANFDTNKNRACIIPNVRMLDKTEPEVREKYLTFIENCIRCLLELDLKPFIMVHQTGKDYEIAMNLKAKVDNRIEVISESDPLAIKGIIGQCYLVISSRFHGIVSSLSQGVPCLATGWSHKYQMLFENYNSPQLLMNPLFTPTEIKEKIQLISTEPMRSQIVDTIQTAAQEQKQLSKQMWKKVHEVIGN